jgi:charged multivesicular body protein 2A
MTPAERLRKHQRALEKTQRELDRERVKLENQEKKLVADIKKSAKNGQIGACKIQAKDLVRTRRYITKFYQMRTQLQAISLRIQTVRSNEQMMQSMKGATSLLGSMNRQMNLPALQRIAMEFERENDIMDQRQEMMDDAIDESAGMEDEEEGEEVVNQILDEIGVDLNQQVSWRFTAGQANNKLTIHSSARLQLAFRRTRWPREGWRKLLAEVEVVVPTMTFRLVWTAYVNDLDSKTADVHCIMIERWSPGKNESND